MENTKTVHCVSSLQGGYRFLQVFDVNVLSFQAQEKFLKTKLFLHRFGTILCQIALKVLKFHLFKIIVTVM